MTEYHIYCNGYFIGEVDANSHRLDGDKIRLITQGHTMALFKGTIKAVDDPEAYAYIINITTGE